MHKNTLVGHTRFGRTEPEGGGGGKPPEGGGKEFKPPATQAELDSVIQDRVRRATAPFKDYETMKAKAEQFDILAAESATDVEKAANLARAEGYNEAMSRTVPAAVRAEFKAAARGVLSKEQLESLLEDLNFTKYADEDGEPDEEKIAKKVAAFAPEKGGSGEGQRAPSFGQGSGHQSSTVRKGEAGVAEAHRRFPELKEKAGKS
jgi:hypothetical protein